MKIRATRAALALVTLAAGCGSQVEPALSSNHPASPLAAECPVPTASTTLRTTPAATDAAPAEEMAQPGLVAPAPAAESTHRGPAAPAPGAGATTSGPAPAALGTAATTPGLAAPAPAAEATPPAAGEGGASSPPVAYTCQHHPRVMEAEAGDCPLCGMTLEPTASAQTSPLRRRDDNPSRETPDAESERPRDDDDDAGQHGGHG